ncbi:MAG: hypothetical protein LBG17_06915 [Bacteroidales bacterium]|jgi:hypothetical protein|nr:hypothetical protein [Bacteroidales bacterium]
MTKFNKKTVDFQSMFLCSSNVQTNLALFALLKRNVGFLMIGLAIMVGFISCEKPGNGDPGNGNNGSSTKGTIVFRVNGEDLVAFEINADAKDVTVDWGDGIISNAPNRSDDKWSSYRHENSNISNYTITISGTGITSFVSDEYSYSFYSGDYGASVTFLDVSECASLQYLSLAADMGLLDVSKCTALTYLEILGKLSSLNVSKCTMLDTLLIDSYSRYHSEEDYGLNSLDVSECTKLTYLDVQSNSLNSLNVSKCTALTYLDVMSDELSSLDVSKCTALTYLSLFGYDNYGNLSSLDVSKCTELTYLHIGGNEFTASSLNALFGTLPTRIDSDNAVCYVYNNPGSSTCDRSIAENKGWSIKYRQDY